MRSALVAAGAALRISAGRSFRRAGHEFGAEPKIMSFAELEELDDAALAAILAEPMLIIDAGKDGSDWKRLSEEDRAEFAAALNEAALPVTPTPASVDLSATEAVFVRAGVSSLEELTTRVDQLLLIEIAHREDQRHILDLGFQSLDDLTDAFAQDRAELAALKSTGQQDKPADQQGGALAGDTAPTAGAGEGQGAAGGDQSAAPADQVEKPASAGKPKTAKKTSTKPTGE